MFFVLKLLLKNREEITSVFICIYVYECYIHSTIFQVNQIYEIIRRPPTHMNLLKWFIPWSAYGWGGNLKCKVINYTGC